MADRTLVVRLVGDEQDLLRSYAKSERATKNFGKTTDQVATKSSKRLSGLAKVGGGLAAGFIAAEGINQVRNAISAAAESERVLTQTRVALESTGKSWNRYGDQIEETIAAQSRLGFDDEALLGTFASFQRTTEDVGKALRLNNLAMDIARARGIELEQAANLVTKATLGQAGALRRVGIDAKGATKPVELLRILTEKYGGSAKAAADDSSTSFDRLSVTLENAQEQIGAGLLPIVVQLSDGLADAVVAGQEVGSVLQAIGKTKIPVLNVPINFEFPGSNKKISDILFKTNVFEVIQLGVDAVKGTGPFAPAPKNTRPPLTTKSVPPIVIQNTIQIDGKTVALATRRYNEIDKRSNPSQKRGGNWRR